MQLQVAVSVVLLLQLQSGCAMSAWHVPLPRAPRAPNALVPAQPVAHSACRATAVLRWPLRLLPTQAANLMLCLAAHTACCPLGLQRSRCADQACRDCLCSVALTCSTNQDPLLCK